MECINYSQYINNNSCYLFDYIDFIPVCPEVEIGLGIPRETIRLINQNEKIHLIEPTTANNYTDKMNEFFLGPKNNIGQK